MGRYYLLVAAAAVLAGAYHVHNSGITQVETAKNQAGYEEQTLAREIAQSGFNVAVSDVVRAFGTYRVEDEIAYGGGSYGLTVTGPPVGPVRVVSAGRFGSAREHQISADVLQITKFLDAVTVDGPVESVRTNGVSLQISGDDTDPAVEEPGSGGMPDVHAVRAVLEEARLEFAAEVAAGLATGVDGFGDIVSGPSDVDIDALVQEVLNHPARVVLNGDQRLNADQVFGSPAAPVIMIILGDAVIAGNVRGYGVLFVDGQLIVRGNARWEGLVFARPGGDKIDLTGTARIFGALVGLTGANETTLEDGGLLGGHIDVDVFAGPTAFATLHEHQYDDEFDISSLDLTSAGCGGTGLCWDNLVDGAAAEVRVEFANTASSSGTFELEAGGVPRSGLITDGLSQVFDPSTLTTFTIDFSSLCDLRGTVHSSVQGDTAGRDNAFSIRVFDTSTNALIYEVVVYHHDRDNECDVDEGDEGDDDQQPLQFEMSGNAAVYYSSLTIMRLNTLLPTINLGETWVENVQEITAY